MNESLVKQHEQGLANTQPVQQGFNFFDPMQFDAIQRACKVFASSELVPDMYKETANNPMNKAVANCMIALEVAQRIGASPLMVMQNLIIIYGKPSWSSKFLISTVNTCGRFFPLQYKFINKGPLGIVEYTDYEKEWVQDSSKPKGGYYKNTAKTKTFDGSKIDDIECIAYTSAKNAPESILESSPISIRLAIQEGWYTKNGSKWQTMAKQMLMYRAASFWTSAYAPELSMGMRTVEENQDITDIDYIDITEQVEKEKQANANKVKLGVELKAEGVAAEQPQATAEPAKAQGEAPKKNKIDF